MTQRRNLTRQLITSVCLLLLAALLLTTATYAWIHEGFVTLDSEVGFTAGLPTAPETLTVWIYTSEDEDPELAAGARWVQKTVTHDDEVNIFPGAEDTVLNSKHTFTLTSLHLGTVDNLTRLTDDNYIYMRMQIDPVDLGHTVAFTATLLPEDGLELYDAEGNLVVDETTGEHPKTPIASLYSVNNDAQKGPLLDMDYAISKTSYTPVTMTNEFKETFTTLTEDITYTAPDDDTYYLYLRVHPNLTAFITATKFIYSYMPCTILYSMNISLLCYENPV